MDELLAAAAISASAIAIYQQKATAFSNAKERLDRSKAEPRTDAAARRSALPPTRLGGDPEVQLILQKPLLLIVATQVRIDDFRVHDVAENLFGRHAEALSDQP